MLQISIEVCETEAHGVVLRYCPLEGSLLEEDRVESWSNILESQLHVLHATVSLREPFQARVEEHAHLKLVHVPGWAGERLPFCILILFFRIPCKLHKKERKNII